MPAISMWMSIKHLKSSLIQTKLFLFFLNMFFSMNYLHNKLPFPLIAQDRLFNSYLILTYYIYNPTLVFLYSSFKHFESMFLAHCTALLQASIFYSDYPISFLTFLSYLETATSNSSTTIHSISKFLHLLNTLKIYPLISLFC